MSNFLAGCKKTYGCDYNGSSDVNSLPPGYIYAPFVTLRCGDEEITVGNKSSPARGNTAIIKSMEYGVSDGQGVKIEIIDEEGGSFYNFFRSINKSVEDMAKDTHAFQLDFGWIIEEKCGASKLGKIAVSTHGGLPQKYLSLLPLKMQVSYEGAKIKYSLEAKDNMSRVGETRVECNLGTEDKKMALKQAIIQLCKKRNPPPKCNVEFLAADGKSELKFKKSDSGDDGSQGPKNVWTANQQNKLAVIRRWISGLVTENNKGMIVNWKGDLPPEGDVGGTLVIMEAPVSTLCSKIPACSTNISQVTNSPGTYIVNGSNKTSVINFSPTINWYLSNIGKSGGSQSSMDGGGAKQTGQPQCDDERSSAGNATHTPAASNDVNYRSLADAVEKRSKSDSANQLANAFREVLSPIEAELKIFGDPSLVYPLTLIGRTLSLIVINPFHLRKSGTNDCPEWLAKPLCNPVFSNKNWMIQGVNHQIKEGSYITIIKLKLEVPNVELNPDEPIGGPGSGGPTVEIKTQPDPSKCEN